MRKFHVITVMNVSNFGPMEGRTLTPSRQNVDDEFLAFRHRDDRLLCHRGPLWCQLLLRGLILDRNKWGSDCQERTTWRYKDENVKAEVWEKLPFPGTCNNSFECAINVLNDPNDSVIATS